MKLTLAKKTMKNLSRNLNTVPMVMTKHINGGAIHPETKDSSDTTITVTYKN